MIMEIADMVKEVLNFNDIKEIEIISDEDEILKISYDGMDYAIYVKKKNPSLDSLVRIYKDNINTLQQIRWNALC